MVENAQPSVLADRPTVGRSLTFRIAPETDVLGALRRLRDGVSLDCGVIGIGEPVALALGKKIPGLRTFPAMSGPACSVPSTQDALCFLLRGPDRGVVFDLTQHIRELVADAFLLADSNDMFTYREGRDLTRFEDGTENPQGELAVKSALVSGGEHLRGSSFLVVQRWVHDLVRFRQFTQDRREMLIGRRADSNDEIEEAPESAHVKRTAQESFEPPAFMLRRSMPWATATQEGLEFIAQVESFDRFEIMMRRMAGLEDGVVDGLFMFSRPVSGGYYWCPPVAAGRLDLALLGVG
ncbi:Dyp-type peroxidase [Hyalangium rubrum]|uniref:Dyp-type peroxidase n=1 Tax=Hyalangium rubrum TaxID=3103134 RepID=A0ABU5HKX4_9BACT|nr:Dyp-type peroxidase [Hyalangium sp. s54d21]MDY7232735.1 Dyp-type peroxidase [Hyalangium sp. s54d21]